MDFLKSLVSKKLEEKSSRKRKFGENPYISRGEADRLEAKESQRKRPRLEKKVEAEEAKKPEEVVFLPNVEVVRRLRLSGLVVSFFGESDEERLIRLRKAEADGVIVMNQDLALGDGHEIKNVFLNKAKSEAGEEAPQTSPTVQKKKRSKEGKEETKEGKILAFFKTLLLEWEQDLSERRKEGASTAVKREIQSHKQCKDYLQPFFKLCRRKRVPEDILEKVTEMVEFCKEGEYIKANDAYLTLAIGNAAWPMGVTNVGIHERAARTKIFQGNIAHVLNDECQRKYITSMKRVMTYCQRQHPSDPSKMFMLGV